MTRKSEKMVTRAKNAKDAKIDSDKDGEGARLSVLGR